MCQIMYNLVTVVFSAASKDESRLRLCGEEDKLLVPVLVVLRKEKGERLSCTRSLCVSTGRLLRMN